MNSMDSGRIATKYNEGLRQGSREFTLSRAHPPGLHRDPELEAEMVFRTKRAKRARRKNLAIKMVTLLIVILLAYGLLIWIL